MDFLFPLFFFSFLVWFVCSSFGLVGVRLVFAVSVTVGNAVKITEFQVPSSYIIGNEENPSDSLILDCAYEESMPNEKDITLKWFLNDTQIYQWMPGKPARALVSIPVSITITITGQAKRFNFTFSLPNGSGHRMPGNTRLNCIYAIKMSKTLHVPATVRTKIFDFIHILKYVFFFLFFSFFVFFAFSLQIKCCIFHN